VELRPAGGLELVIRYITRVQDRFEMRSNLNQRLLAILHAPQLSESSQSATEAALEATPASAR
jgi:hypothetical protein